MTTVPEHQSGNLLSVIEKAIERGASAEQLDKLIALHERWHHQLRIEHYNTAMCACQADMPAVVKDATNTHTKSRYPKLESVIATTKPIYTKHGFSLSFETEESPLPNHMRVVCDVQHAGGHVKRHRMDISLDGTGSQGNRSAMNATQADGSTVSYGRRYIIFQIFNMAVAEEDNDGNTAAPGHGAISAAQLALIQSAIEGVERKGISFDHEAFLAWLKIGSVADMPAAMFPTALAAINRKARGYASGS